MLNKREEPDSHAQLEGRSFVTRHAPRLLDPAAQDAVCRERGGEKELVSLWSTLLEAYFAEVLLGSVNHLYKALLFFELNGVQTASLKRLLGQGRLPRFALAASGQDFRQMRAALRGRNRPGLFDRVLLWLQPQSVTEESCLLIHLPGFTAAHAKFAQLLDDLLARKELVKERELFQHAAAGRNSEFEQKIFLDLMCFEKRLSRNKLFMEIIYSRHYADDKSLPLQKGLFKYSLRETVFRVRSRLETVEDAQTWSQGNAAQDIEVQLPPLPSPIAPGTERSVLAARGRKERLLDFAEVLGDLQRIIDGIESKEEFDCVFAVFRYIQNKISSIDALNSYAPTSITQLERSAVPQLASVQAL